MRDRYSLLFAVLSTLLAPSLWAQLEGVPFPESLPIVPEFSATAFQGQLFACPLEFPVEKLECPRIDRQGDTGGEEICAMGGGMGYVTCVSEQLPKVIGDAAYLFVDHVCRACEGADEAAHEQSEAALQQALEVCMEANHCEQDVAACGDGGVSKSLLTVSCGLAAQLDAEACVDRCLARIGLGLDPATS